VEPGFTDVSEILKGGIYILSYRGRVEYIGKARGPMLARIMMHRSLGKKSAAPWMPIPGVVFDRVQIQPVHPDAIDAVHAALVLEHSPRGNVPLAHLVPVSTPIVRRI